jgi:thiol-disulfide isomerase/thioredoxin
MGQFGCAAVAAVWLTVSAGAAQLTPIVATTGEPEFRKDANAVTSPAMTEAEYVRSAGQVKSPNFVRMTKKPAGIGAGARFGLHFMWRGKNVSWAVDGDDQAGYRLFVDQNANGDLGDEAPLKFEREGVNLVHYLRATYPAPTGEGGGTYSAVIKLVLDKSPAGDPKPQFSLRRYEQTLRQGRVQLGPAAVSFQLHGDHNLYNLEFFSVYFDLDGDGAFEFPAERYQVGEKYVNLAGTSYEFVVDRFGRSLTLTPLAEKRPDRLVLMPNQPVPDFPFTDVGGVKRKLSDYRGKVVLIDFWGIWCGPCVAAIPELAAAYAKYHPRGLEIIGVDANDTKEKLLPFIRQKKMPWIHTQEGDKGPIHRLFRVAGWPSYFIIGKDGMVVISDSGVGAFNLDAELAKLLPPR